MKRHPSLAHLSRDHHPALMLAQLLKKDAPVYKGLPQDTVGKIQYAKRFYETELVTHFAQEEKMMALVAGRDASLDEIIKEIQSEHVLLSQLFTNLHEADALLAMDKLGRTLEKHIRKEERQLFPLIEKNSDEQLMQELEKLLTN